MSEAHGGQAASYFENHRRRTRFPWSIYHQDLQHRVAGALFEHGAAPRVLVVGCGLEPFVEGAPPLTQFWGCDLDEHSIRECRNLYPTMDSRLAVCPGPLELPSAGSFAEDFDVVVAKEVIEHLLEPEAWARSLASRVRVGGELVLTTPNYGGLSTLPIIERTVLEWIAQRDGYSRADIHPTKFDRSRLARLDVGPGMKLRSVETTYTAWALVGRWVRERAT